MGYVRDEFIVGRLRLKHVLSAIEQKTHDAAEGVGRGQVPDGHGEELGVLGPREDETGGLEVKVGRLIDVALLARCQALP